MATMTIENKQSLGSLLDQHHSLRLMRLHLEKQLREINARLAELEAAICVREGEEKSAEKVSDPKQE